MVGMRVYIINGTSRFQGKGSSVSMSSSKVWKSIYHILQTSPVSSSSSVPPRVSDSASSLSTFCISEGLDKRGRSYKGSERLSLRARKRGGVSSWELSLYLRGRGWTWAIWLWKIIIGLFGVCLFINYTALILVPKCLWRTIEAKGFVLIKRVIYLMEMDGPLKLICKIFEDLFRGIFWTVLYRFESSFHYKPICI